MGWAVLVIVMPVAAVVMMAVVLVVPRRPVICAHRVAAVIGRNRHQRMWNLAVFDRRKWSVVAPRAIPVTFTVDVPGIAIAVHVVLGYFRNIVHLRARHDAH